MVMDCVTDNTAVPGALLYEPLATRISSPLTARLAARAREQGSMLVQALAFVPVSVT